MYYSAQKIINLSFQSTKYVQLFYVHVQTHAQHINFPDVSKVLWHIGSIRIQCQCHDPKQRSTPTFSLWPRDSEMTFLFVPDPRIFFHLSETVIFKLYIMSSIELIFFLGSGTKRKVISESLGHKENIGVLRCFGS